MILNMLDLWLYVITKFQWLDRYQNMLVLAIKWLNWQHWTAHIDTQR